MKELKRLIDLNPDMMNEVSKIKESMTRDKDLINYLNSHQIQLTEEKLKNSALNLMLFSTEFKKCQKCGGREACTQNNIGFKPVLKDASHYIQLSYTMCDYEKEYQAHVNQTNNLKSFFMPKKILSASFDELNTEPTRIKAISKLALFAKNYSATNYLKGAFIHGPFGVGKTHMLAAMANALAKRNIKVAFVYLPDMIRELKSAIGTNNLENLMFEIKTMPVLIIDDIGSEMNTQWVRDEIIGPLLQFRMLEELPTFFSSNKSIDELIKDYATTNDNTKDETKAKRIGDRIKALADEIAVTGKNYRY